MSNTSLNSVFYAETYHPIQAGSIDGTDILPHDNAVYRALLCSSAGLYDPFGDQNVIKGDPYCTVFVGHLSHLTTEDTLSQAMSKYGKVKNLRIVRHIVFNEKDLRCFHWNEDALIRVEFKHPNHTGLHSIVTGASRGFGFVEYESEREMRRAYEDAHHSMIDDSEIIVDYNRQQLMPGWIPRRLGGGLGGRKESGQLRFGGRERPFRAPLRPIPWDDLKRLGIPPPPEGKYMQRFEVPSPPRRNAGPLASDEKSNKRDKNIRGHEKSSSRDHKYNERVSVDREDSAKKHGRDSHRSERRFADDRLSVDRDDRSRRHSSYSRARDKRSTSHDRSSDERKSVDSGERSRKRYKNSDHRD